MSLRQVKPSERLGLLYIAVNLFFLSVLLLVLDPGPVTALIVVVAIFWACSFGGEQVFGFARARGMDRIGRKDSTGFTGQRRAAWTLSAELDRSGDSRLP